MKLVYTIDDLESREQLDQGADSPAKLAVIGAPVKHSKSPEMHQASLDAQGFNLRYIRIQVKPGKVRSALEKMEALGFIGVNVTVPHKLEVMAACPILSNSAKQLGAVNTVHFTERGWVGHNTDGPGLANALASQLGTSFASASTLIIGAGGGAGRAIAVQAALDQCPKLTLANRTLEKLNPIAKQILEIHPDCDLKLSGTNFTDLASTDADLIINATSLGMQASDPLPYPEKLIRPGQVFYDAVYAPAQTAMLKAAKARGCATANGLSMLVHQGALSYQMWLDREADLEHMAQAVK